MQRNDPIRSAVVACLAVTLLCAGLLAVNGQTRGRKRSPSPVPAATATPPQLPVIISRADEFPDSSVQTVEQTPTDEDAGRTEETIEDLQKRIKSLESGRTKDPDAKQRRLLLNLDLVSKAEQRTDLLRKQLFEMIDRENTVRTRLDAIDFELRPEAIDRSIAFAGSLRPEDLKAARIKSLESEKANLQNVLSEVQRAKASLDASLQKAEALVERLRSGLEKEIDSALGDAGKP